MRLLPSDPDIATIVSRIQNGDINLQPDFQRGEVWSLPKKQRLIDSILRDWHIPPIHVIELNDSSKLEVLDGQQRLVAIRDFVNNEFTIDGDIAPFNDELIKIDGLYYSSLSDRWRRRFDQFTIRLFKITDYLPQEPGELFFRLNQPVSLTSAEQRNAFYGEARKQIKDLVEILTDSGFSKEIIGFSNSRMAYDDIVARLCYSLEVGDLTHKVTSFSLTDRYRFDKAFNTDTIQLAKQAIKFLGYTIKIYSITIKFNKATLYSWLWFVCDNIKNSIDFSPHPFSRFITHFERIRLNSKYSNSRYIENYNQQDYELFSSTEFEQGLISIYNDRASARVADVSSVLSRDIVIWTLFVIFTKEQGIGQLTYSYSKIETIISNLNKYGKYYMYPNADVFVGKTIENGWDGRIEL